MESSFRTKGTSFSSPQVPPVAIHIQPLSGLTRFYPFGVSGKIEMRPGTVEEYLSEKQMEYEWDVQNALTYRFKGQLTISHPGSGETLWFNQSTELHCSYWEDHPYFEQQPLSEDHYPSHTYYGDGSPIEREVIDDIRKVLWEKACVLKMQPSNLLIFNNIVIQHSRLGYQWLRRHEVSLAHWVR